MERIPITSMGEGISHILALIYDLLEAEKQIFLIEEPENDLHPQALKKLLNLIIEKSVTNQFFISTHSNIVCKILGGETNTKIFNIETKFNDNSIPRSECQELETEKQRKDALEKLGYDLSDYYLWAGWLILEESSAEFFIREYLIPWFTPELKGKLKTVAAKGKFVNKASCSWSNENFKNFSKSNFEDYYPAEFKDDISIINEETDTQKKREKKKALLDKVKDWINEDEEKAKKEFQESAKEIISILGEIKAKLS